MVRKARLSVRNSPKASMLKTSSMCFPMARRDDASLAQICPILRIPAHSPWRDCKQPYHSNHPEEFCRHTRFRRWPRLAKSSCLEEDECRLELLPSLQVCRRCTISFFLGRVRRLVAPTQNHIVQDGSACQEYESPELGVSVVHGDVPNEGKSDSHDLHSTFRQCQSHRRLAKKKAL